MKETGKGDKDVYLNKKEDFCPHDSGRQRRKKGKSQSKNISKATLPYAARRGMTHPQTFKMASQPNELKDGQTYQLIDFLDLLQECFGMLLSKVLRHS